MKKIFLLASLVTFTYVAFAQNTDLRRKIEVNGTAEEQVTPDIINVTISLQEYLNGKSKVSINELENQLESAVKDAGIASEDFTINNISAYNNNFQKKKNPGFLASKQYSIRFHDLNKFNRILSQVDPKGIQYTNIDSYDYSKINDLKRELKIKALLNARDKAGYLLKSIDEKLGNAINITEVDNSIYPMPRAVMFKAALSNSSAPEPDIDFKKIKLSYQINAVFEIVK